MQGDVKTYWAPVSEGSLRSSRFSELRQHGRVYEIRKPTPLGFLFGDTECNIHAGFDIVTNSLILRIPNVGTIDTYLSQESQELETLKKLQSQHLKKSLREHMSELKRKLQDSLNFINVTVDEIRYARTDKMKLGLPQSGLFERTLDNVLNKYFLEPD